MNKREIFFGLALLGVAVFSLWLLQYVTPYGLGLVNDSVGYVAGARNLLAGKGYSRLTGDGSAVAITNFPPFYSVVLAVVGLSGLEIIRVARLVNLLCFAGGGIVCGLVIRRASGSRLVGLVGALLFVVSEAALLVYSVALSEVVYILLMLLVLWGTGWYVSNQGTGITLPVSFGHGEKFAIPSSLILALCGILAGLAYTTRYAALSLFGTVGLTLLFFLPTWKQRVRDGLIFVGCSLPAVIAWSVRNARVVGNPTNRELVYHPIPLEKWQEGVRNFWMWLLPNGVVSNETWLVWGAGLGLLLLALLLGYLWLLRSFGREMQMWRDIVMPMIFILQTLTYPALLVFSLMFLEASTIWDHRLLLPFYATVLVVLCAGLGWLWKKPLGVVKITSVLAMLVLLLTFASDSLRVVNDLHERGQGFISYNWLTSETIQAAKKLPPVTLYTNRTTALYLLANRPAYVLVSPINPATGLGREGYNDDLARIRQQVLERKAVLIIFNYRYLVEQPEDKDWLSNLTAGIPVYQELHDGVIFGAIITEK